MKKRLFIYGAVLMLLFGVLSVPVACAATKNIPQQASIISALQAYLSQIVEQFLQLQKQVERFVGNIQKEPEKETAGVVFTKDLRYGSEGEEVRQLQTLLKEDVAVYPEGMITGFYGRLTEMAVKRLQAKHALEETGVVDSGTREKLNELIRSAEDEDVDVSDAMADDEAIDVTTTQNEEEEKIVVSEAYAIGAERMYDTLVLARTIQEKVNEKRVEHGVKPIAWSDEAAAVAREHSFNQAKDNEDITDPEKRCHYPLIRHEGFEFGFGVGDRMQARNVSYQAVGENIAMVPVVKDLIYRYPAGEEPDPCPIVDKYPSGHWENETTARTAYVKILQTSRAAILSVAPVHWVNKGWMTVDEVVTEIVEGWMNSPGHRENLLRERFTKGGMGLAQVNDYIIATHVLFQD